tara:strand:- start:1085 stop:2044 length:960 start_codon:yes stop_codon:yes gene_type:complete
LRPLARKLKIVDSPSQRKKHLGNIPLIGGISILLGVYFSIIGQIIDNNIFLGYMYGGLMILIIGFIDDCYPFSAIFRVLIQILIVSFVIWMTELKFDTFGHSFGLNDQIYLGYFSYPITVLGIVFVTNALNLMDGADGITGSLIIVAIMGMNVFGLLLNDFNFNPLSLALLGSLIPYLWFNITKTIKDKIFLGDSGSLFLGYSIAFLLLYETQVQNNISPPFALWLITIPIYDVTSVIIYRLKNGKPMLAPDSNHLHHFLQRLGLTNIKVLLTIVGLGAIAFILALLIEFNAPLISFPVFLSFLFIYVWIRVFSRYSKI